jgi:DtxR family Mn-dependent transcriptional regulator
MKTDLSHSHQDYLKTIYMLRSRGDEANNAAIAQAMGVTPASATNMVRRLAEMGLATYEAYRGVSLTMEGERVALEMVRHHRLIELFLHNVLDIPWDQVHAEAEELEHVISEELEETIARKLGYPLFDPHGDPIPAKDGTKAAVSDTALTAWPLDRPARLARVRTQDGDRLRYLGSLGLYPGAQVRVLGRVPFDGPLLVDVDGRQHMLAHEMAGFLLVMEEMGSAEFSQSP